MLTTACILSWIIDCLKISFINGINVSLWTWQFGCHGNGRTCWMSTWRYNQNGNGRNRFIFTWSYNMHISWLDTWQLIFHVERIFGWSFTWHTGRNYDCNLARIFGWLINGTSTKIPKCHGSWKSNWLNSWISKSWSYHLKLDWIPTWEINWNDSGHDYWVAVLLCDKQILVILTLPCR